MSLNRSIMGQVYIGNIQASRPSARVGEGDAVLPCSLKIMPKFPQLPENIS